MKINAPSVEYGYQSDASISLDIQHICIFSEADHRSIELMFFSEIHKA